MLGIMGLHELTHALERQEQLLGVSRDGPNLTSEQARTLQAAWERAESARIEIANDHPQLNAQALISMNSALDALVEEWTPQLRSMRARWLADTAMKEADEANPDAALLLSPELRDSLEQTIQSFVADKLGKIAQLGGAGTKRYETLLRPEGLGAPADRPIPDDMDAALTELWALRNVLIHKAGRVDEKALEQAPSLSYEKDQFVRISGDDYRRFSAAIRCYASEIQFRVIRGWPEVNDSDGPDLSRWRGYYVLGA